jgi:hypothetical protein
MGKEVLETFPHSEFTNKLVLKLLIITETFNPRLFGQHILIRLWKERPNSIPCRGKRSTGVSVFKKSIKAP